MATALTGVDGTQWSTEDLQRIVESNIEPPLRPRIYRVPLLSQGAQVVAFVIDFLESTTVHQAKDGRYYGRSEFEVKALRD